MDGRSGSDAKTRAVEGPNSTRALSGVWGARARRGRGALELRGRSRPGPLGRPRQGERRLFLGSQQSPLDIESATESELPALAPSWLKGGGRIINNGHTIQLNVVPGSKLSVGSDTYDLVQFHFHAPSEHL